MTLRYEGKVTIVTGGSMGIGEGCVRVFVKHGSKVVFCARGDNAGEALEKELNAKGPGEAYYIKCDVTKEDDIKNLIKKTVEKYGQIDCVINNAGTHPPHKPIDNFSADEFRDLLNLNVVNYFLVSKYALPHLRKTKGSIVNVSSLVGVMGQSGAVTYCATKGAITSMSKALAIDEAAHGVRVNTFSPGNVLTPLWESSAEMSGDAKAALQSGAEAQCLGRFGTVEESGEACLYLAAEGSFCTGIDIIMSGGAELGYAKKTRLENPDRVY
ncbi:DgyrCDS13629 [Dimorphilus gyrociliatus]|uniref:DgyrCDS13629 n=1 Tax=Dimorphilus gyrociliatus TaxID=2664684 RepID=A0A7I8WB89_9ANNE|nr:DgyrCDS13629 [Dimorphilus gyrociliatus]